MYRLFITLKSTGMVVPFREPYVSERHAASGITAIEEKGGIEVFTDDGKAAGKLEMRFIRDFNICRVGSDGAACPGTLVKTIY